MNEKYKKKLIIPGILIIAVCSLCIIYQVSLATFYEHNYGAIYAVNWINIVPYCVGGISIALYCLFFHNKSFGKIVYLFAFGVLVIQYAYYIIIAIRYNFSIYSFLECLIFVICILMVLRKIVPNKVLAILGIIIFSIYAITVIITCFNSLEALQYLDWAHIYLLQIIRELMEFTAFLLLWLMDGNNSFSKKQAPIKTVSLTTTSIESELVSLRQQFESGNITEQEYSTKKSEILNKL